MEIKLKEYVNNLFLGKHMSNQTKFLKENLLKNSLKFYNDLINSNLTENEAYEKTISYINDMYNLVNINQHSLEEDPHPQKKSAILTSIAVMLYILCPVPIIVFESFGYYFEIFGLVLLFVMIAIATGLLIYNSMIKKKYFHNNLYDYKYEYSKYYKLRKSISSIIWILIVALYLFISFRYMIWSYSWIIFLIGAAIEQVLKAYFDYKEEKEYEKKI